MSYEVCAAKNKVVATATSITMIAVEEITRRLREGNEREFSLTRGPPRQYEYAKNLPTTVSVARAIGAKLHQ